MSRDFAGNWEIKWQDESSRKYPPGQSLTITRQDTLPPTYKIDWHDDGQKSCSIWDVPYVEDRLRPRLKGRGRGCSESEEPIPYDVDITFLLGQKTDSINGRVALSDRPPNDDPLTGLWTADRQPGGDDGEGDRDDRPAK